MKLNNKSVYIFIGPPGAGKGTLSYLCEKEFGWVKLSTGNLCRKHIEGQSEIGKQIDFAIKSGKLISDALITDMVTQWLGEETQEAHSIILDGFPRTVAQAEGLEKFFSNSKIAFKLIVVRFFVSDETVMSRLNSRYICSNPECQIAYSALKDSHLESKNFMMCDDCLSPLTKRNDDNYDAIKERLMVYHQHENVLLHFYEKQNRFIKEVNVEKPVNQIFDDFKQLLEIA